MRILFSAILVIFINYHALAWGQTGHRVIGRIAELHLTNKAKKKIRDILEGRSIAMVSTYMDEIRSDSVYDHLAPWHYCTIPDGMTYQEAGTPEEGDIISALHRIIAELKSQDYSLEDEAFTLKCLIHLVGDIHQPLHVGNGMDRGGNDIEVEYFWRKSNLHRVWDVGIIDGQNLSYTEYTDWIHHPDDFDTDAWLKKGIEEWAYESMSCRNQVYNLPENRKINYAYNYHNIELVNLRLLQAGIRLARILNEIFG